MFYIIFALAVTASVQLMGVYLVGAFAYALGLIVSSMYDMSSGAIIVWALVVSALFLKLFFSSRQAFMASR